MKFKFIALSVIAIATSVAQAADPVIMNGGTVHFTGELLNAACAVSSDSENQTVALGQYRTAGLAVAGNKTTPVPFQIKLVGCDPAIQASASVAFYGQTVSQNVNLLSVSAGGANATAAKNVGIEVSDDMSNILAFSGGASSGSSGSNFSTTKKLNEGTNVLNFSARYVATGASTPGIANADSTFVVKYE